MNKTDYLKIVNKLPGLTADGFLSTFNRQYGSKRAEFLQKAVYLQETLDACQFLQKFSKSHLMTNWQHENCIPSKLQGPIEWSARRPVSRGAIVVAAVHLGFELHYSGRGEPCFNIFARQLEGEFRDYHVRELIKKAVG